VDYTIIVDIVKSHGCRFFGQQGRVVCTATTTESALSQSGGEGTGVASLHQGTGGGGGGEVGVTFKFSNASLKLSSLTNVGEGQIAQLYYISA